MVECGIRGEGRGCRAETRHWIFKEWRALVACRTVSGVFQKENGARREAVEWSRSGGWACRGGYVQCSSFCPSQVPVH